jgi:hypothetical protein
MKYKHKDDFNGHLMTILALGKLYVDKIGYIYTCLDIKNTETSFGVKNDQFWLRYD